MAKVGINLTSVCLNLRRAPNVKADRVCCFGFNGIEGLIDLKFINSNDNWMKVKLKYCSLNDINHSDMDEGGCGGCCFKVEETEFEGWMKAASENGIPNIWYSVTSY